MKKVTLVLLMLVTVAAYSSEPGPWIGIKFKFGKPSLECAKFGVCTLEILFNFDEIKNSLFANKVENEGYGYPSVTKSSKLSVRFSKSGMTASTYKKHFSSGYFIVEENYKIPQSVVEELGLPEGYIIKTGKYKFTETTEEIIITL